MSEPEIEGEIDYCGTRGYDAEDREAIAAGRGASPWYCTLLRGHQGDHSPVKCEHGTRGTIRWEDDSATESSLADGWDVQAADLRVRAANLQAHAAALRSARSFDRDGDVVQPRLDADPDDLGHAATRNIVSATVLENCARQLRAHLRVRA